MTLLLGISGNLDKIVTPSKPQFLSVKKIEKHLFLRAVLSKEIMHLKCLAYARSAMHIHFFSLSVFLMPCWISPQGI